MFHFAVTVPRRLSLDRSTGEIVAQYCCTYNVSNQPVACKANYAKLRSLYTEYLITVKALDRLEFGIHLAPFVFRPISPGGEGISTSGCTQKLMFWRNTPVGVPNDVCMRMLLWSICEEHKIIRLLVLLHGTNYPERI